MIPAFEVELERRLNALQEEGLYRELRRVESPQGRMIVLDGRALLNFSSNDYLGLADEPALREAANWALERYGTGSGASRLVCGSLAPHHALEGVLAEFKQTEAALTFSSGYAAAIGTVGALVGPNDVVVVDRLVHAAIIDGARLSRARLRVFEHNNPESLERILRQLDRTPAGKPRRQVLVITESVFSMDGDVAPLRALVDVKERYGAWLMLDEAHATGVSGQIEVQLGTMSKALGVAGGFVCGSRALIDYLVNRARSFIFSTAPPPSVSAAAAAGVRLIQSSIGEQRRVEVWQRAQAAAEALARSPARTEPARSPSPEAKPVRCDSLILPWRLGSEQLATRWSTELRDLGLFVPGIRYPAVARGAARLRLTVTAHHRPEDIAALRQALAHLSRAALD
jgi:8-amino-7-oxononanoate synthase